MCTRCSCHGMDLCTLIIAVHAQVLYPYVYIHIYIYTHIHICGYLHRCIYVNLRAIACVCVCTVSVWFCMFVRPAVFQTGQTQRWARTCRYANPNKPMRAHFVLEVDLPEISV